MPVFNASNVDLDTADPAEVICYIYGGGNDYDGQLGARISALFVIMIVSTCFTFFPVVAKRIQRVKIPLYVYLFARYFGSGVIIATAFIHLLDPAYGEIGPNTCVGMTGNWAVYSWPPAIVLVTVMAIFILNLVSVRYVEIKFGIQDHDDHTEAAVTRVPPPLLEQHAHHHHNTLPESSTQEEQQQQQQQPAGACVAAGDEEKQISNGGDASSDVDLLKLEQSSFEQQIAAFLILEFGVIFHSVIIGLNLGVAGAEFAVLYPVLVFHQSFEGLGIGSRLSAIPMPPQHRMLPWILCSAYGLTTPVAIAVGLGLRTTYDPNSFTANVISGLFDSMSAGILIYTGLVELLAKDFLYDPARSRDNKRIAFMLICVLAGAGIMALLGKWA